MKKIIKISLVLISYLNFSIVQADSTFSCSISIECGNGSRASCNAGPSGAATSGSCGITAGNALKCEQDSIVSYVCCDANGSALGFQSGAYVKAYFRCAGTGTVVH